MRYVIETDETTGEKELVIYKDNLHFSRFSDSDGERKRALTKAFDKRREVKIGGTFNLPNARYVRGGFGNFYAGYKVNRIDRNVVEITGVGDAYLVSNSKKELLKHEKSGFTPVHYKYVIF